MSLAKVDLLSPGQKNSFFSSPSFRGERGHSEGKRKLNGKLKENYPSAKSGALRKGPPFHGSRS